MQQQQPQQHEQQQAAASSSSSSSSSSSKQQQQQQQQQWPQFFQKCLPNVTSFQLFQGRQLQLERRARPRRTARQRSAAAHPQNKPCIPSPCRLLIERAIFSLILIMSNQPPAPALKVDLLSAAVAGEATARLNSK
jgi:hypothetical protein